MRKLPTILMLAGSAALAACSGSTSLGASGQSQMTMSLAGTPDGPTASPMLASAATAAATGADTIISGSDVLIITSAQLVLRQVELESNAAVDGGERCDDVSVGVAAGPVSANASATNCAELKLGPILFDVPLGAGVTQQFTVTIPAGTYHELKLQIHKPTGSADQAFLAANPTFDGVSVRVVGTFNGTPFTFTTDLTAVAEIEFPKPVTFAESGAHNVTLQVDVGSWFHPAGGAVIDPASALKGQPNENTVKQRIRASLHAFEDDDHNGLAD